MKDIKTYISESAEFELIKTEYREYGVVTLVRHENLDLANMSKEEFVKLMGADLKEAVAEYAKIVKPLNNERVKDNIEREIRQATKFAEKKWKTEKKRNEYIENARKNAEAKKWYLETPERIFFDLKPDKGQMGINEVCILRGDKTDDKQLEKCYDELQNSKYFKKGTGWAFKYESHSKEKASTYAFRPYVDILLDESDKAEQKRDEDNLTKSVQQFYANTNYWGD